MRIEPFRAEHAAAVARLHVATLTGLVSMLGESTARVFYRGCAESPLSIGFVAVDGGRVRGFVLGSTSPGTLKRDVVARHPIATALAMAGGVLRTPRALGYLARSFRGPDEGAYDASAAELTYIAVARDAQRSGTGRALLDAFTGALREKGVRAYELSVDEDNAGAAAFYQRNGFTMVGRYREFGRGHVRYRRDTGANDGR